MQTPILIGMEDAGHYHFNLLKYLLSKNYNVVLNKLRPVKSYVAKSVPFTMFISRNSVFSSGAVVSVTLTFLTSVSSLKVIVILYFPIVG